MANKISSSICHKILENHGKLYAPHENLLSSVIPHNPNPILIRTQNDLLISTNHPPSIIFNSNPFGDPHDKDVLIPRDTMTKNQSKRRGRPKGSKNKPKAPMNTTPPQVELPEHHILEVPSGFDIVEKIQDFVQRKKFGVVLLTAVGQVRNVSFQNHSSLEPPIYYDGIFELTEINGFNLGSAIVTEKEETSMPNNYISINMKGHMGDIFGGSVVELIAASNVLITMSKMVNCEFNHEDFDH